MERPKMFWGLELEPEKTYKSISDKGFHISMACLQPMKSNTDGYTSFIFCQESKNFVLCNLHRDKAIQVQLDLNFQAGEEISFLTKGAKNKVYLSGYVIDEEELDDGNMDLYEDSASDEEMLSPENEKKRKKTLLHPTAASKVPKLKAVGQNEESSSEDDDEDEEENAIKSNEESGEEEESDEGEESDDSSVDESPVKLLQQNQKKKEKNETPQKKQNETLEGEESDDSSIDESPVKLQQQNQKKKEKNETPQKKPHNTPVSQTNGNTPKSAKKNKRNTLNAESGTPKRTLEGGVVIEDTKVGNGTPAKPGKVVAVYYTGRLKANNKQFDATTQGPGFKFRMGKGEVIKGWDIGINGMKIGGKRKITIPAALAYGPRGSLPQIPPNAPLVFEVELKAVS